MAATERDPIVKKQTSKAGIPWKIYLSRALSAWGDRMWSFGGGLFMNKLDSSSLRLVAIYGFVMSLSVIVLGAAIGNWIDRTARMTSAKTFLVVQNVSVAACCAVLGAFFWQETWFVSVFGSEYWARFTVAVAVILLADVANLASLGSKIVVEKDWIVVIAGNDQDRLATINTVFRTLDLVSNLLAPAICGVIFDFLAYEDAALFIAAWNLVSVAVEYGLLSLIYAENPQLAVKEHLEGATGSAGKKSCLNFDRTKEAARTWRAYFTHSVRFAGLGLAFLYMTVLGFDNITYGFCLAQCVPESVLGGLVGLSAIVGVAGSLLFPVLRRKINVSRTGVFGMTCLVLTLCACVVSIWLPGSPFDIDYYSEKPMDGPRTESEECQVTSSVSVIVFLTGIIGARFGLWLADLSVTQILQESVEESMRGSLNGVQGSLNSAMDMVKFVLVIALPDPETFGWLILVSFASICCGAISFGVFASRNWNGLPKVEEEGVSEGEEQTSQKESRENEGFEPKEV